MPSRASTFTSPIFTTASSPPHLSRILSRIPKPKQTKTALPADVSAAYSLIHTTLSQRIIARSSPATSTRTAITPYITQPELLEIVGLKLMLGVYRPALLSYIRKLSNEDVIAASRVSFACIHRREDTEGVEKTDLTDAFSMMTRLKGVGPATASLILSLVCEDVPFYSDEVAYKLMPGEAGGAGAGKKKVSLKYTLGEYAKYVERLDAARDGSGEGRRTWERRVWVEEMWEKLKCEGDGPLDAGNGAGESSGEGKEEGDVSANEAKDEGEVGEKRKRQEGQEDVGATEEKKAKAE